ncbi:MAG: long-chain-fatty-acid--CoA ligase [Acidimicrobiia bacterium]
MMDIELNAWLLYSHLRGIFADTEVVSQGIDGARHRTTYGEVDRRAHQLMHALDRLGLARGVPVATLAWNGYRHLEAYVAVPSTERVLHTLNVRLSPEDLAFIVDHARDQLVFVEADLVPLLEEVHALGGLSGVAHLVVLDGEVPPSSLPNLVAYEDLIADEPTTYPTRSIDELAPMGMCYTSGTTGKPKGAVYTHRSTYLHASAVASPAGMGIGPADTIFPVVPMFHASAWGMVHAGAASGAKQVFLAGSATPVALAGLLHDERVTVTAGVPTVWHGMLDELAGLGGRPPELRAIICGGSQPPRVLIDRYHREFAIPVVQAWGMTESSPLASVAWPKAASRDWEEERLLDGVRTRAGLPLPGMNLRIVDDAGAEVAWDGESMGNLLIRGPWVISAYLYGEGAESFTDDGWFRTGDVAIGFPDGYFTIADRTKDLIKSGGEWISSVDMEAAIMAMAGVVEAAVVAIPDPRWDERPLACVVPAAGSTVTIDAVRDHLLASGFSKWQLPDRLELIDEVPRTSVGKFDKKVLRARFE